MSAEFYAADLGISIHHAKIIADVVKVANKSNFITFSNPWANHGKVRVYFDVWSQNSLPAIDMADKVYFDVIEKECIVDRFAYGNIWKDKLSEVEKSAYSGAKTRNSAHSFLEAINEQKTNWS